MPEKILVVDDDVDTLRLVGLMLQRQGYQIVAASNGHQALALAQNENPDLILLDVMMPDMDGYEVTKQLRGIPVNSKTPIIMFTAKSQVDDKVAGFEAGVDDYLTKPTQPRELFAHVKAVLARTGKGKIPASADMGSREKGYVVGIISAKGGMGVSTLATNLGIALRQRSQKEVIVAELRPGEGSIALDLGYLHPEGLDRLLQKKANDITVKDVETELVTHKSEVRFLFSTYQPGDAKHQTAVDKFETIARHLGYLAKIVVLDLGPAISPITDRILPVCDEVIVLLEPHPQAVMRTQLLMEELTAKGFGEGRVNVILYNRQRTELQLSLQSVQQQFKHPVSVVFTPAPELIYQCARNAIPLITQFPDNLTSQQFAKLADNVARRIGVSVRV